MQSNTCVCNVKVKFIRPQYQDLSEWMADSNNVYVGRKGIVFINGERFPKKDSLWANPYKINKDSTRETVIDRYKKYIIEKLENDDKLMEELKLLKGKTLGCWCHPEECHADVLVKLVNEYF